MKKTRVGRAPLGMPFSLGVVADDTFYLSGSIGFDENEGRLVEGGIEFETRKAIENLAAVLEKEGMDLSDAVKVTVYLADMNDYEKFNRIYREYFSQHLPARETIAVSGLALGARIELSLIAVKD